MEAGGNAIKLSFPVFFLFPCQLAVSDSGAGSAYHHPQATNICVFDGVDDGARFSSNPHYRVLH